MSRPIRLSLAALVLAAPALAAPAPEPPRVTIDARSFAFYPRPIQLAAGRPVTLLLTNRSGSGHDFTAPGLFAASNILAGTVRRGRIQLPPHSVRAVTLVPAPGRYRVHCAHFMHAQLGMRSEVIVS